MFELLLASTMTNLCTIGLTLKRPSASIDAFEVFDSLHLHQILIFFSQNIWTFFVLLQR